MNKPQAFIVHHTAVGGDNFQLYAVNRYHRSKGFPISSLGWYVGYHWFIEKNGDTIRCRADKDVGAHTLKGWNTKSIGVSLAGDFNKEMPTPEQIKSLKELKADYPRLKNFGAHRKYDTRRTCFGGMLSDDWLDRILKKHKPDKVDKEKQKLIRELTGLLAILKEILANWTIYKRN